MKYDPSGAIKTYQSLMSGNLFEASINNHGMSP